MKQRKRNEEEERTSRLWDGIPVRDAEHELRIHPSGVDVEGAVRGDEQRCVMARACHRLFGSTRVAFCRTVAYVELLDENGKPCVERFQLSTQMVKAIAEFDRTGKARPGGYILSPPSPGRTLDHMRQGDEKRKKQRARSGDQG